MPFRYKNAAMEFRHLRYFIAVAEELNFTRAAERLQIAQPALSRQIQQLEEEIRVPLFSRNRRQVVLTFAGETFLVEARKLVTEIERALDTVRPAAGCGAAAIRVALAAGVGEKIAPVFREFGIRFPLVDVQCNDILSTLQNEALRDRTIDVGFLRPPADSEHLTSEHLYSEPIMALMSKSNPLAKRKFLRIADLANEPLLLHERRTSTGIYDKILEIYRKASVNPKIVHTRTGPYEEAGTMLVAGGKGIFLVGGGQTHRAFNADVTTVQLSDPDAFFEVHVAWRTGEISLPVLMFIDTARSLFKSPREQRRT
jgi:DNA-binding transcriptional LysR family regulator